MKATGTASSITVNGSPLVGIGDLNAAFKNKIDTLNECFNNVSKAFSIHGTVVFHDADLAFKEFGRAVKVVQNKEHNKKALCGMRRVC